MRKRKYIISAKYAHIAHHLAKQTGLNKSEYVYVAEDNNMSFIRDIRDRLRGEAVPDPTYLIGFFSQAEIDYLVRPDVFTERFGFDKALKLMKQGKKVKRKFWGGYWFIPGLAAGTYGDESFTFNKMIVACLKDNGGHVPATPYQSDLLAEDWEEA